MLIFKNLWIILGPLSNAQLLWKIVGLTVYCYVVLKLPFLWMSFWQVRRALIIMHQRDEVEYKRERRVIYRKA